MQSPRINKRGLEHRERGFREPPRRTMRYVGIDIGSEKHWVAAVDGDGSVVLKATPFEETGPGYEALRTILGPAADTVVVVEATGHYWQNLLGHLVSHGFEVVLLNPIRTHLHAKNELARAKTDAIDALRIAQFAAEKKLLATSIPEAAIVEIRELVRWQQRILQEVGDKVRVLHRLVDLGFPELKRIMKDLQSAAALELLRRYPTAESFKRITAARLAGMPYGARKHKLGPELAGKIVEAARTSVGRHHSPAYRLQVIELVEDLERLQKRLAEFDDNIRDLVEAHELAKLIRTIPGIGDKTALRLIAELGDPARFRDEKALAAYVGVTPGIALSGKKTRSKLGITRLGSARVRYLLYMPTLAAIRHNPWIMAFYERLLARGKDRMVAVVACMRKLLTAVYSVATHRRAFELRMPSQAPAT